MAKSGSTAVTVSRWNRLVFSWSTSDQSEANNTSTVTWALSLVAGLHGTIISNQLKDWSVTVNGTKYSGTNMVGIGDDETETLASGSIVIKHAEDGTKSFSYSFTQYFGIIFDDSYIGTLSGSGSGTLDTIPRASQPSLVTWPGTTNDVGDFGETFSIHMNRVSDAFTHTVRYAYGDRTGTIATGVTTGTTWAVPLSFMNDIPDALAASGRIYVDTYLGSTKIGTKYTGFTVTVPANVRPTCGMTLDDVTGVDDIYGSPVQGLSQIKVTINTTPAYSSPIVSYTIKANGATYTTPEAALGALKASGDSVVTVSVKDKRGRTNSASYTMKVQAYALPSISKLIVRRCNADGTENDQGDYIQAALYATISSMNAKNTATYTLRYKKTTDTIFTDVVLGSLANVYAVNGATYIFAADSNHTYDVEVVAQDRHGSTTRSTSASTAFTLMNWGADGTSMGVGKVAEKKGTLEIALDVEFIGKVKGSIFDAIYPVGSIYLAYNHTDPSTLFGGTWVRMQDGFLWASRETDIIGQTGGEKTVTLTVNQIPTHNHGGTYTNAGTGTKTHAWLASGGSAMTYEAVDAGGGQAHNNMPPYIQVSIWRRTA